MKKRCLITLFISLLLLLSVQSYALSPGIKPSFPDIIIGNVEDNAGLTIDLNFYQFPNALNLDEYVIDWDTPASDLKWSFMEEQDGNSWIEINGVTQLADIADALNPPPDKELRVVNNILHFRDVQASPHAQDPGPYTGTLTVNRMVTIFVSDGVKVDKKNILISSVAGAVDQLIPKPLPITLNYDFVDPNPNPLGWQFLQLTSLSDGDISDFGLRTTINTSGIFEVGIWSSPDITPVDSKLYLAKFYLDTDQALDFVPDFRLRWGTLRQDNCSTIKYTAVGTKQNVIVGPTTFNVYFEPIVPGNLYLGFDVLAEAGDNGNIYVSQVDIAAFDKPTSSTKLLSLTTGQFDDWTTGVVNGLTEPTFEHTPDGKLSIGSSLDSVDTFGFWQSPMDMVDYVPSKLYKVIFGLSTPDESLNNQIPEIRLRAQAEDHQFTATYELYPDGDGIAMPTEAGRQFNLWFQTPNVADSPTSLEDGFFTAVDILDIETWLGGTVELYSLDVEYYDQPLF